ncbi:pleiotropic drug resistance protein [Salix suchowensis]|nr:pleiotropic drug resistance protein [Salix suchowensis]
MNSGDFYQVGSSLQANSSSIWRNNGMETFSRSSREVDDEEALKWAVIERLPTYSRLRKGLLTTPQGEACEIDIHKLGFQERKNLMERLVKVTETDNEKVGIEIPTVEVRFEHLNVETEVYLGSRALPTIFNSLANVAEGSFNYLRSLPTRKKRMHILNDVSGIIKPCRMALLLGPPGSGKTTLLLALAGKLHNNLECSGRVTYNGHEMNEFVPQRTAAYISQHDLHTAEMTVRETLSFSARCQGTGARFEMLAELLRREKAAGIKPDPDLDVFMKVLGLEVCADTILGDELRRGVSGGQKKRVTAGEMLVGSAKVLLMDEISTGLDSSTTFQIMNSLKQCICLLNGTAFISLLQPAPETYDLFDDIILLSDGHIVYQGPSEHVLEFFESMGFKCPERKGVADFLQEVTSRKDQKQYWARRDEPHCFVTVKEFSEAFQSFHVGRRLRNELAIPFERSKSHPSVLTTEKYGVSKKELLRACFSRELLLMKRNSFVYIFKLVQLLLMALIGSTVFVRTEMHRDSITDGGIYMGALFFILVMIMFNGMSEIGMSVLKLPVFYKQRDLLFYPAWAYALPTWILKIPITIIEVAVWVFITYYTMGFDPNVGRFFRQFLVLFLVNQMASALFRLLAAIGRNLTVSCTMASFVFLMLFANCGFVLSRENVKKWFIWGYWISPMMYGENAMAVNEFLGKSWSRVLPFSTEPLGVAVLKSRGFFTEAYWYWVGVGALIGFTLAFNFAYTAALTCLDPFEKLQGARLEESPGNKENDKRSLELLSQVNSSVHQNEAENQEEIRKRFDSCRSPSVRSKATTTRASQSKKKGMILPFEQHFITFDEITYSVHMPQEMKDQGIPEDKLLLLRGVSGAFKPGVLTALMGVTGAGKTTLMDVLAGRKTGGYIEGNIIVSGYPKRQQTFARISGYCEQNDIHSPLVTVYESLLFSAWLRLPVEIDEDTRKLFIEEVMELVELTPLREALVGLPGVSGLSTEQRKRLTIAVELVANPCIIFMDEPTTGLDARAAAIVMRTVRNTVDTGRTVVCTIHQPSIDIFESFDELFLLKQGGQEIYAGPLGRHSCELIKYFEGVQGVSKIKDGCNPATWMLEITSSVREITLGVDFTDVYRNSELYRTNKELIKQLSSPSPDSKDLYFPNRYQQSFFRQFIACLLKQRWSYGRNPPYNTVRFLVTVFIALMFGAMFWDLGSKTTREQDLLNAMGSMYAAVLFLGVQNSGSVQPVVSIERTVFYRERAAGMYSAFPYAIAQVVIEFPYLLAQAVAYSIIVYSMIGFEWTVAKFSWYLFYTISTLFQFTFFGMMAVGVTPNHHMSTIISSAFYAVWNLFSGFMVPLTRIPVWWRWFYWACPMAWTLYGLLESQYGDRKDMLDIGVTVDDFMRKYFSFRHDFLGVVAAVNVGFAVLFALVFSLSLKMFNFQKR